MDVKPEVGMTGRRRTQIVEERADLILANKLDEDAYSAHFEAQMRRGKIRRRLLYASYVYFVQAGAILAGSAPEEIS